MPLDVLYGNAKQMQFGQVASADISGDKVIIRLGRVQSIKGKVYDEVWTYLYKSRCGLDITIGRDYLFLVEQNSGVFICNGSSILESSEAHFYFKEGFNKWKRSEKIINPNLSEAEVRDMQKKIIELTRDKEN